MYLDICDYSLLYSIQGIKRSLRRFQDTLDSEYGNLISLKVEMHVSMNAVFVLHCVLI